MTSQRASEGAAIAAALGLAMLAAAMAVAVVIEDELAASILLTDSGLWWMACALYGRRAHRLHRLELVRRRLLGRP